jgi:hypothetical protein
VGDDSSRSAVLWITHGISATIDESTSHPDQATNRSGDRVEQSNQQHGDQNMGHGFKSILVSSLDAVELISFLVETWYGITIGILHFVGLSSNGNLSFLRIISKVNLLARRKKLKKENKTGLVCKLHYLNREKHVQDP